MAEHHVILARAFEERDLGDWKALLRQADEQKTISLAEIDCWPHGIGADLRDSAALRGIAPHEDDRVQVGLDEANGWVWARLVVSTGRQPVAQGA